MTQHSTTKFNFLGPVVTISLAGLLGLAFKFPNQALLPYILVTNTLIGVYAGNKKPESTDDTSISGPIENVVLDHTEASPEVSAPKRRKPRAKPPETLLPPELHE